MKDAFSRTIDYLRISVTDRCNERCLYCLPENFHAWTPREDVLSYPEILATAQTAADLGARNFRVTGGEPLVRKGIAEFIGSLKALRGVEDVGLSTNGTRLATYASELAQSGLRSANISFDALDPEIYQRITGGEIAEVRRGIDAARSAGITKIKLNTVLMRGVNESQILPLVRFAAQEQLLLRFIELMPVSISARLTEKNFFPIAEARRLIEAETAVVPTVAKLGLGPAVYDELPELGSTVGFIGAMTNLHFCEACNKMRLTADGKIRPCLGQHGEVDLKPALRPGVNREQLRELFLTALQSKPLEHAFRDAYEPGRIMTAIGG